MADDRGPEAVAGHQGAAASLLESAVMEVCCCSEVEVRRSPVEALARSLPVGEGEIRACLGGSWVVEEHRPGLVWVQRAATVEGDPHGAGWVEGCWVPEEGLLLESPVWRSDSGGPLEDREQRCGRHLGLLET